MIAAAGNASADVEQRDERRLMKLIESGDTLAFEELYDRYRARAFRTAWSVCRNSADAEDAVQETFICVWRSRSPYRPERGSVAAWLLTAVRYKAIDITRRSKRHARHEAGAELIELYPAQCSADRAPDPDDAARLRVLLKRIPHRQCEVIALAFYGQLTHVEIADHLQLPVGTVKGRMRLGLHRLRSYVELDAA